MSVPSGIRIMYELHWEPDLSVSELAERIGVSVRTIQAAILPMFRAGMVTRSTDYRALKRKRHGGLMMRDVMAYRIADRGCHGR
jgi:DNA-binding MarR family transcriptional regulator